MDPLTVPGSLEALAAISRYVLAAAQAAGLDKKAAYRLRLAVDEIATNIIVHGYDEAGLQGTITVQAQLSDEALTLTLADQAVPFDPRALPLPEHIDDPLNERPIGGLGVYLALRDVDDFDYAYRDGQNHNQFRMHRSLPLPVAEGDPVR